MSAEEFLEIFDKMYSENKGAPYIVKTPNSLLLLGTDTKRAEDKFISIGLTPDIMLGIRLIEEEKFYIRDTFTENIYECEKDNLSEYKNDNWTKDIFLLISKIKKIINITGAELLFHSDFNQLNFKGYYSAVIYAFSNLFSLNDKENEFKNILITDDLSSDEKIYRYTEIASEKNNFIYIENNLFFRIPFNLDGYKFILAIVEKKSSKLPIKKISNEVRKLIKMSKTDLKLYEDLPEYKEAMYIINENERINSAINFIKCSDIEALSKIISKSANEYLSFNKLSDKIETLYKIMSKFSNFCNIYKDIGVFILIKDENVDTTIKKIGEIYQEQLGFLPYFYICNTSGSEIVKIK